MIAYPGAMRVLCGGLGQLESVRWHGDRVWFSDWTSGRIHRLDPASGDQHVVAEVASLPLCFDFIDDELVVLDARAMVVLRGPAGGTLEPWIDVSALAAGAGNEVLADGDGGVYLNFGNFDPRGGFPTTPVGLVAQVNGSGEAEIVAEGLAFPNGMVLTPDGARLLVAESHAARISAFPREAAGGLGDPTIWATIPDSAPDGISMAPDGACWFADVPHRCVTRVKPGDAPTTIQLDRGAFSCAVSADGGRIFIAAANWPGGARMFDPTHDWDGQLIKVALA